MTVTHLKEKHSFQIQKHRQKRILHIIEGQPQLNRGKGVFLTNYTKVMFTFEAHDSEQTKLYYQSPGLLLTNNCIQYASVNLCMILARASEQSHFLTANSLNGSHIFSPIHPKFSSYYLQAFKLHPSQMAPYG